MGILKKLFKKKKSRFLTDDPKLAEFKIGDWTIGRLKVRYEACGSNLTIGNYCSFANESRIFLGGEHDTTRGTTYAFDQFCSECKGEYDPILAMTKGDVFIGSDVWIGYEALILSGVSIGHGAIIGANAVIAKNVELFSIVVGNPARHIRYRFNEETRERLLKLAWWDWSHEKVIKAWPYLEKFDIDKLEAIKNEQ